MSKRLPEAPEHLSERGKALWGQIVTQPTSAGRLALLQTGLEALDRADQAKRQVDAEGLTTTTKTTGAVHVHPLVKVERENRQLFVRIWDQLALQFCHATD